jgi:hypothetical protein
MSFPRRVKRTLAYVIDLSMPRPFYERHMPQMKKMMPKSFRLHAKRYVHIICYTSAPRL